MPGDFSVAPRLEGRGLVDEHLVDQEAGRVGGVAQDVETQVPGLADRAGMVGPARVEKRVELVREDPDVNEGDVHADPLPGHRAPAGEAGEVQSAWNFVWSHNRNRGQWPWTMGDGTWVMYDYHRGYDSRLEYSGMADAFRMTRSTKLRISLRVLGGAA